MAVEAENACIASSPARLGSEQKDGEPEQAAAPGGDVSGWRGVVTTQPYASAVFARAAWILENSLSEPLVQHAADLVSALTCISAEVGAALSPARDWLCTSTQGNTPLPTELEVAPTESRAKFRCVVNYIT